MQKRLFFVQYFLIKYNKNEHFICNFKQIEGKGGDKNIVPRAGVDWIGWLGGQLTLGGQNLY